MKTTIRDCLLKYDIPPGCGGLKHYKYWTPGLPSFKSKYEIVKAIEIGLIVYRRDKIMGTISQWDGKEWSLRDEPLSN